MPRSILIGAVFLGAGLSAIQAQPRQLIEDTRLHKAFHSRFLAKDRDVIVWLPPGYNTDASKRYPALYMHDGLNVFTVWRLDETAYALISNNQIFREVKNLSSKPALRIWLDIGTREGPTDLVKQMRDALKSKGWTLNSDLVYFEAKDAGHGDEAFGRRASLFLKYLFAPQNAP